MLLQCSKNLNSNVRNGLNSNVSQIPFLTLVKIYDLILIKRNKPTSNVIKNIYI